MAEMLSPFLLLIVQGAANYFWAAVEDVGVDHGGTDVFVPQQLLNGADIVSGFEEVGGKGMTKGVGRNIFADLCTFGGVADRFLDSAGSQMVTEQASSTGVPDLFPGGKYELPSPFARRVRIFSVQRIRQRYTKGVIFQVLFVNDANPVQLILEWGNKFFGEHGDAVLVAFAATDSDLLAFKIEVLDTQAQGFV